MAHNANLERIFSLMAVQWTKGRDNLSIKSVESILQVLYKFGDMSCRESYVLIECDVCLPRKVTSTKKYLWVIKEKRMNRLSGNISVTCFTNGYLLK